MISIIISTKDKKSEILEKTLHSIKNSQLKNGEIIIIDQNEKDLGTKKLIEDLKIKDRDNNYFYLRDPNTGLSCGRNLGLKFANKAWVWFLDDDAILPGGLFNKIKVALESEKDCIFYGKVLTIEKHKLFIRRAIFTSQLHLWNFDSVCSIALLFSREALNKINGFNEKFGLGSKFGAGEEGDMIIRGLKNKIKIKYLKDFIVYHPTAHPNLKRKFAYGYGIGALYRKYIFSSLFFGIILGTKFIMEVLLRSILILFSNKARKIHYSYLKGFILGFLTYKNER